MLRLGLAPRSKAALATLRHAAATDHLKLTLLQRHALDELHSSEDKALSHAERRLVAACSTFIPWGVRPNMADDS
jgi:hypothetical protein